MIEWIPTRLGNVLKYEQPTKYIVASTQYKDSYSTPVLTAGQSFILGHTNEENNIFSEVPVIIFDDFTTAIKYVDFPFKVKSSAMKILKNNKEVSDIRFLFYLMKTLKTDSERHKRYWISTYAELKIPLPPLDQQKKIAAILDAADAYRQKTKALITKYEELTQSLFLDMFGDPVINPMGWEVKVVEKVCKKIYGGGTPAKAHLEYFEGDIPWVTPKDMKSEYIGDSRDHINQQGVDNSSAKLIPKNSVLMVIRSGILKHTLPVAINTEIVTVNQDMKAYIPNLSITNAVYLKSFFQAVSKYLLSKVRAVTADNIEFKQIKELSFICPPLGLQNQFAERVQAIEVQKTQAQASLVQAEDLFNSLLQRAFKGELS
jgi:type I restriction enzyme S subunit